MNMIFKNRGVEFQVIVEKVYSNEKISMKIDIVKDKNNHLSDFIKISNTDNQCYKISGYKLDLIKSERGGIIENFKFKVTNSAGNILYISLYDVLNLNSNLSQSKHITTIYDVITEYIEKLEAIDIDKISEMENINKMNSKEECCVENMSDSKNKVSTPELDLNNAGHGIDFCESIDDSNYGLVNHPISGMYDVLEAISGYSIEDDANKEKKNISLYSEDKTINNNIVLSGESIINLRLIGETKIYDFITEHTGPIIKNKDYRFIPKSIAIKNISKCYENMDRNEIINFIETIDDANMRNTLFYYILRNLENIDYKNIINFIIDTCSNDESKFHILFKLLKNEFIEFNDYMYFIK